MRSAASAPTKHGNFYRHFQKLESLTNVEKNTDGIVGAGLAPARSRKARIPL